MTSFVWTRRLGAALLVGLAAACGPKSTDTAAEPAGRVQHSADRINPEEIEPGHWQNAYDMVAALRPQWLSIRGRDTILGEQVGVQVYVDGTRYGETDTLRNISVNDISSARFYNGVDASARWGSGHHNGVIYIVTKK